MKSNRNVVVLTSGSARFKRTTLCAGLVIAFGGLVIAPGAVIAQESANLQRVEITGSAVRRIDAESALHVQVLTKQDIARTGVTSTEALLQSISALSSAGSTSNSMGAGLATYGMSSISLRGLESARTLVLVNGRRLATFADGDSAVNINVIPLAAIERVEVLKDGASSIYGADAMAGVVNFILTQSFEGVEVGVTTGTPTASGGGKNDKATITAGLGGKDGSPFRAVLSASFEKETALFGKDRAFSASANNLPYYSSGATGQGNIEGAVVPGAYPNDRVAPFGNSPASGYGNPMADAGTCGAINMFLNATKTNKISPTLGTGAPFCAFDTGPFVGLVPERELMNFTGNFGFKINPQAELFADVLYSRSKVIQTFQAAPLRRQFAAGQNARLEAEGVDPSLIIYPSNPNYPTAYLTKYGYTDLIGKPLAVTARVFDFGGRQQTDTATQTRFVVGAKGTIANQDYEVAMMSNESKLAGTYTGGVFSVTDYNRIINDPTSDWNPWIAGGAQTGALAGKLKAAQYLGGSLDAVSKNTGLDSKLTGELFGMGGGAAQYAVGLQARRDSLKRTPAEKPGSGDIAGAGGAAFEIDRSRSIQAVFGELNLPILKDLEGNVSLRSDKYSDFGVANTYKVSGRYQPNRQVLLRASHNIGFRAPTLPDLYQPQVIGSTEAFNDPATGQDDLQVTGITGGNESLRPEKSKSSSIGFVISPVQNFSIGIDLFNIRITDIIQTPGAQEVVSKFRAGDPAFKDLVVLNGADIDTVKTVTSNMGTANVAGVDIFASFNQKLGAGRLDIGLNGTYMSKFEQTSPSGTLSRKVGTIVEEDGTPVLGADSGGVVLRWKHALSGSWTQGSWTSTLTQNFTSGYRGGNDLNDDPTFVGAQSIFDLNVAYRGIKNATLMVGVKNLLDTQPAVFVPASNQFQSGYDITQYDPRGRFVYISGNYKF